MLIMSPPAALKQLEDRESPRNVASIIPTAHTEASFLAADSMNRYCGRKARRVLAQACGDDADHSRIYCRGRCHSWADDNAGRFWLESMRIWAEAEPAGAELTLRANQFQQSWHGGSPGAEVIEIANAAAGGPIWMIWQHSLRPMPTGP